MSAIKSEKTARLVSLRRISHHAGIFQLALLCKMFVIATTTKIA
jgi:hypothetical protein